MAYVVWSFLAESVLNRRLRCRGTCFAHGRGYRLVADVAKLMRVRGRAQRGLHQRMEAAAAVCESVVDFRTATFVRECVCMRCTLVFYFRAPCLVSPLCTSSRAILLYFCCFCCRHTIFVGVG